LGKGGGAVRETNVVNTPQYFVDLEFCWAKLKRNKLKKKIGVGVGERGESNLRAGSNQTPAFF
jgi:hypothetical protein